MASKVEEVAGKVSDKAEELAEEYSPDEERPLGGYAAAMAVYGGVVGTALIVGKLAGKKLPAKITPGDFALMAVGTHKMARILAKDAITSPIRAPFTEYKEPAGDGELNEEVRQGAKGWRHTVGELIECPFCLAVWVATFYAAGFALAPRLTRWVAAVFSSVAVSDALQLTYDGLKKTDS